MNIFNNEYNVWSESCCQLDSNKRTLYMEITTICNAKCSFCSAGKEPARFISLEFVKEILDELVVNKNIVDRITLTGGEPLLYPRLDDLLKLLSSYELDHIAITTNAVYLKNKMPILEKYDKLKYINISRPDSRLRTDRNIFCCEIPNNLALGEIVNRSSKSFRINTILGLDHERLNLLSEEDLISELEKELERKLVVIGSSLIPMAEIDNYLIRYNYYLKLNNNVVEAINSTISNNLTMVKSSDKCMCTMFDSNIELRYVDVAKEQEIETTGEYIRNFVAKSDNHLYGGWSDKAIVIK